MRNLFVFMLFAILLSSCGSSTIITGSWKEEGIQPLKYQKIAVITITEEEGRRRTAESAVVQALKKQGVEAVQSYAIFPEGFLRSKPAREAIQAELLEAGADGVLTITVLGSKEETRYVPGTTMYSPGRYPYYGSYYGYYSHWAPMVYDPGYYTQYENYFLESNFYNVAEGKLIWSAQSKTTDPSSITDFAQSYASRMVSQMVKDKVLERN